MRHLSLAFRAALVIALVGPGQSAHAEERSAAHRTDYACAFDRHGATPCRSPESLDEDEGLGTAEPAAGLSDAPLPPLRVRASDGTHCGLVRVQWYEAAGAIGYQVWRNGALLDVTADTTYDDHGAVADATYSYTVRACNSSGQCSGDSDSDTGYWGAAPSSAPDVVVATVNLCDSVLVQWSSVPKATSYDVYRNGSLLANTQANEYADTSASVGPYYEYTVAACDGCCSGPSEAVLGRRVSPLPPPENVRATDGSCRGLVVSWDEVDGAEEYEVYRDGEWWATELVAYHNDSWSTSDGVVYSYAVTACNAACGCSDRSSPDTGYRGSVPDKPQGVEASDGTYSDRIRITWSAQSGLCPATEWQVFRHRDPISPAIAELYYDDFDVLPGELYWYEVKAGNYCGWGEFSDWDEGYRAVPATPTATPSRTPTPTATSRPTNTPTATPSRTPTPTSRPTSTPSATPSRTPTPTATSRPTSTPSATPSRTPTPTATSRSTSTPSATPSRTPTSRPTATPTHAPTPTPTPTSPPRPEAWLSKVLVDPASGTATVGDSVRFELRVDNTGPTDITLLPLGDNFHFNHACISYQSASPPPDVVIQNPSEHVLRWSNMGTLQAGDRLIVSLEFRAEQVCEEVLNRALMYNAVDEHGSPLPDQLADATVRIAAGATATATAPATPTATSRATHTPTGTVTETAAATRTATASSTSTPSTTPTQVNTPTPTATAVPTDTPTTEATRTPTVTATSTAATVATNTPTTSPTPTSTHTPTRTATATPTASATPTMPRPSDCTWIDSFDGGFLEPDWSWVREDPSHWSLAARPGYLRIRGQQGTVLGGFNNAANVLLRDSPEGDFEVSTRLMFAPTEDFQAAGLLIYQDDDSFLSLSRAFCGAGPPLCVGDGAYLDIERHGVFLGNKTLVPTGAGAEAYLKLVRRAGAYQAQWSHDGERWRNVGAQVRIAGFEPTRVGLLLGDGNTGASEIPADFDYFCLSHAAAWIYLPLVFS